MIDEFSEKMRDLKPHLMAYANFLTKSDNDAEDLVQDTMCRAWRYRAGFQNGTNMRYWLFKIMRNEFLSQVQKRPKNAVHLSQAVGYELTQDPDQEWRRLYHDLMRAVDELSGPSREALLLVSACGFSYEKVAEMHECAVGTIKSRVSRARDRVALLLAQTAHDGRAARREVVAAQVGGQRLAMQRHG